MLQSSNSCVSYKHGVAKHHFDRFCHCSNSPPKPPGLLAPLTRAASFSAAIMSLCSGLLMLHSTHSSLTLLEDSAPIRTQQNTTHCQTELQVCQLASCFLTGKTTKQRGTWCHQKHLENHPACLPQRYRETICLTYTPGGVIPTVP
jgi:hypothetical protein